MIDTEEWACAISVDYTDGWFNHGIVLTELDQDPESGNEGKLTKPDSGTYSSQGSIHRFLVNLRDDRKIATSFNIVHQ